MRSLLTTNVIEATAVRAAQRLLRLFVCDIWRCEELNVITVVVDVVSVLRHLTIDCTEDITRGIAAKKTWIIIARKAEEQARNSRKKLVKFRHDRFYGTTKAVLPTHRARLDINLNYAPRSFPPPPPLCSLPFPSRSLFAQRWRMSGRERTAVQAASAINRIHKVGSAVCFMFAIDPSIASHRPRRVALHRLSSTRIIPPPRALPFSRAISIARDFSLASSDLSPFISRR